ncbi:MAG: phosphonate C-P lyase system protein PhnG [Desulfosarcinaceae bacterium]|nr:phosphonate C-P lyase system protein PhnG [Desulfosarcinaceae bacterium]
MVKEKIFETLMQGDAADLAPLAARLREQIAHDVLKPPTQELVMFQMEESVEKIDFNVGEILVTSAEVRVADAIGYSMVMETDAAKALDGALLMGVYEADLPAARQVEDLVEQLDRKHRDALRREREMASATRVHFEVMGGQDPNVKHNAEEE